MPRLQFQQVIHQLEKRKGGYYYLKIAAETVEQFEKKRHTRLRCNIDGLLEYSCGLNHYGDGNYFIILSGKNLKKLGKELHEEVSFEIFEDPNPLGVEVPEVLEVLLVQDEAAKATYDKLTDGRKRSLIHSIKPIKDLDKQVDKILKFLEDERMKLMKKKSA